MPLAIQLGQSPAAGPIFTPLDDPWLWRTVKAHVQCADAQVQECVSHLLRTHMVMETVAVATHRQLSIAHPLHQLLVPHCRFTLAINRAARDKMLAPGGPIDNTMGVGRDGALALCAKAWKDWSFAQYDLRADLAARGVDFERFDGVEQDEQGVWAAPGGALVAWFKDPDGNVLSLTQF
jgi:arachidonate 15-lipoxygenase